MANFVQFTQTNGKDFFVEVECVCAVEDRGSRRRLRMVDQSTMDVTEPAADIVTALETA